MYIFLSFKSFDGMGSLEPTPPSQYLYTINYFVDSLSLSPLTKLPPDAGGTIFSGRKWFSHMKQYSIFMMILLCCIGLYFILVYMLLRFILDTCIHVA